MNDYELKTTDQYSKEELVQMLNEYALDIAIAKLDKGVLTKDVEFYKMLGDQHRENAKSWEWLYKNLKRLSLIHI